MVSAASEIYGIKIKISITCVIILLIEAGLLLSTKRKIFYSEVP